MEKIRLLLQLLSDGNFQSGETLGKALGLTRAGVWKIIQQCRDLDIPIISITNKGYCLEDPVILLDPLKIKAALPVEYLGELQTIEVFDSLSSTNDYLMSKMSYPNQTLGNQVCLAELQTQGKGRMGRTWVSPYAKNLAFSMLWRFPLEMGDLSALSLVTAIALIQTLEQYVMDGSLKLKWPNDILWNFKKLSGILIELKTEAHTFSNAMVGIGLNVATPSYKNTAITQPWIDLQSITQEYIDRNLLTATLIQTLINNFNLFQMQGFAPFILEWNERDLSKNQWITLTTTLGTQIHGKGLGINEKGHLILEFENGVKQSFASGDVSIRLADYCYFP